VDTEPKETRESREAKEAKEAREARGTREAGANGTGGHANLFIAVPLPDDVKRRLAEAVSAAQRDFAFRKWVHPADYHITVKFLGPQDPRLASALRETVAPAVAGFGRFALRLAPPGVFGRPEAPRILWMGVGGDRAALGALQQAVEQAAARLGFPPEQRPYAPHITMARQWTGAGKPDFDRLAACFAPLSAAEDALSWEADELVLYRTRMGRQPMYERLDRYPLVD